MPSSPPRDQRRLTFIKAHLRWGNEWADASIANVSASCLMVKCQTPPPLDASVEIRRRGTSVTGRVVWVSGSRFGLQSHDPVDVTALLAKSDLEVPKPDAVSPSVKRPLWHWRLRNRN
jgi:hypothetical protein